ncbi:MAG: division/cell wall cluster transcriptional repressor MraZ [Bacteroidetes bacterium]|nr:division/cell wall cluster transcriptional repressor MraZ [Bacteroidota bacterium]
MFQGYSKISLDAKSRFILPAKFRKNIPIECSNQLILTRGIDDCIKLYPKNTWDEKVMNGLLQLNTMQANARKFVREILFYVNEVEIDSQGRILIPPQLMQFANFEKEIEIIGTIESIEIWNPKTKEKLESTEPIQYNELAEKISEFNIDIRL